MKKNFLMGLSALVLLGTVAGCVNPNSSSSSSQGGSSSDPLAGTYDIKVWVSETDGVAALTQQQIDEFEAANPGIVINAAVEGVSEANSATNMITDITSGADLYCFAQDQLARLVQVGALNKLGVQASETVTALNDEVSVKAATVDGSLYCYPLTSDNGYFMYYDKSIIKESSLDSLEAIIADCEAAGKNFSFDLAGNGWYNASFFFATGCKSDWTVDDEGKFKAVDDTFNSDAGLVALKGMRKIGSSSCHVGSASAADFGAAIPSAVVISGTWDSKTAQSILGENFGATDLPSFEVDGKSYHLGSFSGNKLMGVKPQTDAKKAAVLQKLALYLTNEECQLERFDLVGWGPSNKAAQATDKVKADVALSALAKQNAYAIPQGQIHGSWWDISKSYATVACQDNPAATDAELKEALEKYEESIKGLFAMSEDELQAFGLVGGWEGGSWETDTKMEQKPAGTYYTTEPILFKENDEFKVRQGKSWDVNYGTTFNGGNIKVTAADAGYRYVKMVVKEGSVDTKENAAKAVVEITLEKYNPTYSWGVTGAFADVNWDKDVWMEYLGNNVYLSEPIVFAVGNEYKVRQGGSWTNNFGVEGFNAATNFKIETAGTYRVKLTLTGEQSATVELVPAE
jgi:arabinogalactan oligomer/maltooligosaccharide transport system substrate-binding protein